MNRCPPSPSTGALPAAYMRSRGIPGALTTTG